MLIDWFTVGAQILNFLILVWLLKRYLYQPVLNAIERREQRIANELSEAHAKAADAEKERADFRARNHAFDQQHGALLAQATNEAAVERERLLTEAQRACDELRERQIQGLRADQDKMTQRLSEMATTEVLAIARRVLADLATARLEDGMADVLIQRLRTMAPQARMDLEKALATSPEPACVRSRFELTDARRAEIEQKVSEVFGRRISLRFETSPERIAGIELSANGQLLAWSLSEYLDDLEARVGELLAGRAVPPVAGGSASDAAGISDPSTTAPATIKPQRT